MYRCKSRIVIVILFAVLLTAGTCFGQPPIKPLEPDAVGTLTLYFDLLTSGNIQSAGDLWVSSVVERAERFGITYENIPIRVDAGSPIIRNLDLMKEHLQPVARNVVSLPGEEYSQMHFQNVVMGTSVNHNYYSYYDGRYYWLTVPQDYYSRTWPVIESDYFRIHFHPDLKRFLNPIALESADSFVKKLASDLNISKKQLKQIAEQKIEYFYCDDDTTVENITGFLIKGTLDLATNDIISAFFPHHHEVAHLLLNIKLKTLPLYSLPLLREGYAVHCGGRWGKAPETLYDLGVFLYREEIVFIDSLLTMSAFERNSSSDIAYPVAGLFTSFILERVSRDEYLDLYRSLSGSFDDVYALTEDDVRTAIAKAIGAPDWDEVMRRFDAYIEHSLTNRLAALPGKTGKGKIFVRTDTYTLVTSDDWLEFEFKLPPDSNAGGSLLFGLDKRLAQQSSGLFETHFGDLLYEGYRWSVRYDANEAGLYDYATDHMVAKYIWGISPSEDYFDEKNRTIRIRFRKELVPADALKRKDFKQINE